MTRLFKRCYKLTAWRCTVPSSSTSFNTSRLGVGEQIVIEDMRIQFRVRRDGSKHPNSCDIEITNLSPATRTEFETKPLRVQLAAGYDGVNRLLYEGDLRFGMSKQDGPNWTTLLQLGDGSRAFGHARVNRSYPPGTTYRTVLKDAARSMGFDLPKNLIPAVTLDRQFVAGTASHGPSRDELTRLLAPFGYNWSIQNGVLRVLQDNEVVNRGSAIPIGLDHGMIGTPEFGTPPKSGKPPHMTVRMLLYPELVPGSMVQLTSRAKNGLFKLEKVDHDGDTHDGAWQTEVEIKPV